MCRHASLMIRLEPPNARYQASFLLGAAEFAAENQSDLTYAPGLGYGGMRLERHFEHFVRDLIALGSGRSSAGRYYADHVLWLLDDSEYVGQVSIRPELATGFLITYGGHVGYSIRPSRRGRGYGKRILRLSLPVARQLGLRRVLVTCNADNHASRRIIEANGGRMEIALRMSPQALALEKRDPNERLDKLRFWIDLEALEAEVVDHAGRTVGPATGASGPVDG